MARKRAPKKVLMFGECPAGPYDTSAKWANALQWYNTTYDHGESVKFFRKFVAENKEWSILNKVKDGQLISSVGIYAKMLMDGLDVPQSARDWFNGKLTQLRDALPAEIKEPEKKKAPSQFKSQAERQCLADLDDAYDAFCEHGEEFEAFRNFKANGYSTIVLRAVVAQYQGLLDELEEAKTKKSEDLKEAYAFLKPRQLTARIKFVRSIVEDAEQLLNTKKAQRKPRATKTKASVGRKKASPAAKIEVKKSLDEFKIESVNPEQVVGANVLYAYHAKYNQLMRFVASGPEGLTFSGSSLVGFDEKKSTKKVVKDKTFLTKLSSEAKLSAKRGFDAMTAKEQPYGPPRARINDQVLFVRVFK